MREELNGNKIIKKRYFGEMSSIVLASNRMFAGYFFISVGLHSCVWACLRPFALIKNDITIICILILLHYKLALVCVCAMCIGRLGTPLILQKHAHFQNRFGEC